MPDGSFHTVDGIPHFLSHAAAAHLLALARDFDLVWASGWEEKAEEYLPRLLGLPAGLPFLSFERSQGAGRSVDGHWKLAAINIYAGTRRWRGSTTRSTSPATCGQSAPGADAFGGNRPRGRAHLEGSRATGRMGYLPKKRSKDFLRRLIVAGNVASLPN